MTPRPLTLAVDRSMRVPRDHVVRTAWVPIDHIRFACRDPMAPGDVEIAHNRLLQNRDEAGRPFGAWPCPVGAWDGPIFVLHDGRHERLARQMMGDDELLVAWLEPR
jgi:hypothetical protein